jgi:exopolyphosphatase / guanosine-5'-triphosphate,3'-diphosphate pyrophosphatase
LLYIYHVRLAIIDCGTNTFHLLIVEMKGGGEYVKLFNTRISVKLGESTINMGFIASAPFERGIQALVLFKKAIEEYKVEKVMALATSAIRDAANRKEFVEAARVRAGIALDVIDGNREAELIYLGNQEALSLGEEISLIMDIGGGSTEFILANKSHIYWKQSFNIGAARLLEKFKPSSPVTLDEQEQISQYLKEKLSPVYKAVEKFPPVELIGSSGAFDSVVEMINGELDGEPLITDKTGYEIDLARYYQIFELVKSSTLEQRKNIRGLIPMRFDMIVISCLMIDFALTAFGLQKMRISTYSLKEGALRDFINKA